jgi:hypothetical protein
MTEQSERQNKTFRRLRSGLGWMDAIAGIAWNKVDDWLARLRNCRTQTRFPAPS